MNPSITLGDPDIELTSRPATVVASYPSYPEARRAVDRLDRAGFPMEGSAIVGRDLRLVEHLKSVPRTDAVFMGAASGAWWGLFAGALLGIFVIEVDEWLGLLVAGLAIGAFAGAINGLGLRMAMSRRPSGSMGTVVADRYDITVTGVDTARAAAVLASAA